MDAHLGDNMRCNIYNLITFNKMHKYMTWCFSRIFVLLLQLMYSKTMNSQSKHAWFRWNTTSPTAAITVTSINQTPRGGSTFFSPPIFSKLFKYCYLGFSTPVSPPCFLLKHGVQDFVLSWCCPFYQGVAFFVSQFEPKFTRCRFHQKLW